jgi:4'-phosphopantetheinyl transferase EntD
LAASSFEASPLLLKSLIPPSVRVHEGLIAQIAPELWPEEESLVADAVETRRREFAAGRTLARRALAELGGPQEPIRTRSGGRAPVWPAGFVGSISHTRDYAAAAVARTDAIAGVGIDLEDWPRLSPRLEAKILRPGEVGRLADLDDQARAIAAAAVFSAKEAFYKLQHPLTSARLGFQDAQVELDKSRGAFRLVLLVPAPPFAAGHAFDGRYAVAEERVAAALWIDAGAI